MHEIELYLTDRVSVGMEAWSVCVKIPEADFMSQQGQA